MMAEAKTDQEPSIEEILNSIRQIISDDGDGAGEGAAVAVAASTAAAAASHVAAVAVAPRPVAPVPLSAAVPLPSSPPPSSAQPLDLAFKPVSEPAEASDAEILELTEKVNPQPAVAAEVMDNPKTMDKPMTTEKTTANTSNALLSAQTADAATEALSKLLAGSLVVEKEEPGRNGKVTLESLTVELMKPLLKAWLDQNLPAIIEKIVQKEVEKLSRRADR